MIKRRNFLRAAAGLGGLALAAPLLTRTGQLWADEPYYGPFWINLDATGGWDPRLFFDPTLNPEQNRVYNAIASHGNISYAPWEVDYAALPGQSYHADHDTYLFSNQRILEKWGHRFTVINGLDTSTINHALGRRLAGSGRDVFDYPSFGTIFAAATAPELPLTYVSGGGYDTTAGELPLIRVFVPDRLMDAALPNHMVTGDPTQGLYQSDATLERIRNFQQDRMLALHQSEHLPRSKRALEALMDARARDGDLARIQLPPLMELADPQLLDLERCMQRTQLILQSFVAGLSVSGNLQLGLFDSHSNNDVEQRVQLPKLWGALDFLLSQAETTILGNGEPLSDHLYVFVTSDFGRGPHYNKPLPDPEMKAGKDHWSIGSMIAIGPDIPGDRVIGGTDDAQLPKHIDPVSLSVVQNPEDGVRITPASIHQALRTKAGVQESPIARKYPIIGADNLLLFG